MKKINWGFSFMEEEEGGNQNIVEAKWLNNPISLYKVKKEHKAEPSKPLVRCILLVNVHRIVNIILWRTIHKERFCQRDKNPSHTNTCSPVSDPILCIDVVSHFYEVFWGVNRTFPEILQISSKKAIKFFITRVVVGMQLQIWNK